MMRVFIGYDIHRLALGRKLFLGGVEIPSDYGSVAHSDGDVLLHSIIDALLSPFGTDIGQLFPNDDETYKGGRSVEFLGFVKEKYLKNVKIENLDSVIVIDTPKIQPFVSEMKKIISEVLDISSGVISIKGKTSENTKLFSVECFTVALLDL